MKCLLTTTDSHRCRLIEPPSGSETESETGEAEIETQAEKVRVTRREKSNFIGVFLI